MQTHVCGCGARLTVPEAWTALRCVCGETWTRKTDASGYRLWRRQRIDGTVKSLAKVERNIQRIA
jgi:hypothetical protein